MIFSLGTRILKQVDARLLWKLGCNLGWKGMKAVSKHKKRLKKGELYPAFMMISITDNCNLNCQGCWVTINNQSKGMDMETLNNIIVSSKKKGSYFFGLLGGEPLMYPHLMEVIERHPDCYFQMFTNGTLLTDEVAQKLRKLGNVSPLISVEGLQDVSDIRRGANNVYGRTMTGIEASTRNKLFTGVATSVCKSNFKDLVNEEFVNSCIKKGIHYLWFYIYRPVGERPTTDLALSEEEILELRQFMVDIRVKAPLMIIDTYWDEKGKAICPGALGLSHHINPYGDIEFCPPIQFAGETVGDGSDIANIIENSKFIGGMRKGINDCTQGCILLDNPQELHNILKDVNAYDSSKRNTSFKELNKMKPCAGHHIPGKEIPEKSWVYRFAKKHSFFGFGAYG
ncbi:radical SAM protein [Labilibaculum euxinus]|uniref:Radical SAM protein n=1 Tax=Labilibaculum euxinus TaxID=2686357 RepID=A0A7M4D675_9BACT|nr:radical SAM protein [Labilibaculum euxinus]MUP38154.1 radical SAM protein [Labilibaculum euxinus]MVB07359.1 radical SAM protein [Labilibaculum euxinus]